MKMKIVIRVSANDSKSRSEAMKIAVSVSGVESVALTGPERKLIEVVGEGIDAVELTKRLRKKVSPAELVSVAEEKEKKEEKKEKEAKKEAGMATPTAANWVYGAPYNGYQYQYYPLIY